MSQAGMFYAACLMEEAERQMAMPCAAMAACRTDTVPLPTAICAAHSFTHRDTRISSNTLPDFFDTGFGN